MRQSKLSKESIQVLNDLKQDIEEMLLMGSNIEVIWKLEELQNNKAFLKSAEFIRKSLKS